MAGLGRSAASNVSKDLNGAAGRLPNSCPAEAVSLQAVGSHPNPEANSLFERFPWLYVFFREKLFRDDTARIINALWPSGSPPAGTRLIELGCGPGFYSRRLASRFPWLSVQGVDSSARQVDCAQAKAEGHGLQNCRFESDDVLNLSHLSSSFDVLIAARLFTILPDQERAMRRCIVYCAREDGASLRNRVTPFGRRYRSSPCGFLPFSLVSATVSANRARPRSFLPRRSEPLHFPALAHREDVAGRALPVRALRKGLTEPASQLQRARRMKAVHHVLNPAAVRKVPAGLCALAIMTKAPRAGQVKTRLTPPFSPEEAAALNICFLRDTAAASQRSWIRTMLQRSPRILPSARRRHGRRSFRPTFN